MAVEDRDRSILRIRDRMIERRPGLRDSFGRFLRDFKKYTEAVERDSATSGGRRTPRRAESEQRGFRA